jgi:hypothetical protein
MAQQAQEIRQYAGHTVTWKQYVSAVTANAVLGLGDTLYYREQPITAVMSYQTNMEHQAGVGQIAREVLYAMTPFEIGSRDELVWQGVTYRVESDSQPSRVGSQWKFRLERGDS